jgi:hypothetical protein
MKIHKKQFIVWLVLAIILFACGYAIGRLIALWFK